MKTQLKRISKSTLAVVLTLCMLFSCATVGIIATDAAKISDSGVVGGYAGDSVGAGNSWIGNIYLIGYQTNGDLAKNNWSRTSNLNWSVYSEGSIVYDTNNNRNSISFKFMNKTVNGNYYVWTDSNKGTKTVNKDTEYTATEYGTYNTWSSLYTAGPGSNSDSSEYEFTPSKRYVIFNVGYDQKFTIRETDLDPTIYSVLKGDRVMFYYGDAWGTGWKHLKSSDKTDSSYWFDLVDEFQVTDSISLSDNSTFYGHAVCVKPKKYYITNDSKGFAGIQMSANAAAGNAYLLYSNNNNNNIAVKSSRSGVTGLNSSYDMAQGSSSTGINATLTNSTSVANGNQSVKYYYATADDYVELTSSVISNLAVGSYTVYAVVTDGTIYVNAGSTTLNVTASANTHTVRVDTVSNATVTATYAGSTAENGETLTVPEGQEVEISIVTDSGYQMTSVSPNFTYTTTAAKTGITYTGSYAIGSTDVTITPTISQITQHLVSIALNNANAQIKYTVNTKQFTSWEDYSGPFVVDDGTNVSVKASTSGLYSVSEWKDGTTVMSGSTDTEKTFSNVTSAKNISITATKPSLSKSIYVKAGTGITVTDLYIYLTDNSLGQWPGTKISNISGAVYDSASKTYAIPNLNVGQGIIFNNAKGKQTPAEGYHTVQYGRTYTVSAPDDNWNYTFEKIGDPTDVTTLRIKKTAADNTTNVTGVYVWSYDGTSDQNILGDWGTTKSNLTGSIASPATKTVDGDYYVVTIPNTMFSGKTNSGNFWVCLHLGEDQTVNVDFNMAIGYTYKIEAGSKSGDKYGLDVEDITDPDGDDTTYYLAGEYTDGTAQFFGTAWSPDLNELTKSGSVYTRTFTSNIPAGTIKFKVVKNGKWADGAYPEGGTDTNQTYVIQPNATSVTFTFDPSTKKTTVTQVNSGSGTNTSNWIYSGTNAEQNPTTGMSAFDASTTGNGMHGQFRFVYGSTDTGLSNQVVPEYFYGGDSSNAFWIDFTDEMNGSSDNFFVGLSTSGNQGDVIGNGQEEFNDSAGNKTIKNASGEVIFYIEDKNNSQVGGGTAHYLLIRGVDWDKVSAISIKAWDNSGATNGGADKRNGKVDYQIFYKAKVAEPVTEAKVVDIIAKNGTLRDSSFNRFTKLADTTIENDFYYEEVDSNTGVVTKYTSITDYNNAHTTKQITISKDITYGGSTYDKIVNVPVGAKIKISTELSPNGETFTGTTKFSDSHYLKAYSFNGMTYKVFSASDGVATAKGKKYTEEWTVRAVNTTYTGANDVLQNATTDGKTVEVTPIYYMQDNSNCKTFYIDGYDGEVQNAWGNMLAVYPYYENVTGSANAFGGYPGQPMLFWGGKYQMEIPLTVDGTATGASVKGLTLHNAYWDLLHRSIDIRCNARNHAQTYDYDDFYKLYKEKNPDTIIFDFKYRTKNDNFGDKYNFFDYAFAGPADQEPNKNAAYYTANDKNGVELLTDYFGRQVDVFGNLIADANKSNYDSTNTQTNELLIVSTGYKDTYVGEYATLWAVYKPEGDFLGYISSSMLYLNNWERRLQYTGGDSTDEGRMSWDKFKTTYKALKENYTGVPALISYEREIWNEEKDKANRSDGKWYYSNTTDKISASIKIQYGSYTLLEAPDHSVSSSAWKDDAFDDSKTGVGGYNNIGTTTGCSAYFTNTTPNLNGKVESGEQFADSTKSFTFQAVPSGAYMFAGWVRYSNGKYYEITEDEIGESPMSANDVYIARFVNAQSGTLTIQHVVEQTDTFTGTGTPSVTVTVKNGNNEVESKTVQDGSKIDISNYINAKFMNYTIDISLTTTPTGESFMKEIVSSSANFATSQTKWNDAYDAESSTGADTGEKTTTVAQFKVSDVLDSGVTALRYVSHLMTPKYTYKYEITYTYTSRFWGDQSYTVSGTFANDSEFAASTSGTKTDAKLSKEFIINKTPYEKNFRQTINWNYDGMSNSNATAVQGSANTYEMTASVSSANTVNDRVTAEFILPYAHTAKGTGYTVSETKMVDNNGSATSESTYVYDTSQESITVSTQAYHLFTYDDSNVQGSDTQLASKTPLIEAAPYVMTNVTYHYKVEDSKRYYTGNSFTVDGVTYYLNEFPEGVSGDGKHKVINSSNVASEYTVEFTKAKYIGTAHAKTTYKYAVSSGQEGTAGFKVYFFAYNMNDMEEMVDNEGNVTDTPVFNGQYVVYSEDNVVDGIVANTGVKKYFTRWDIFNTKGDFVASCYNRRFTYSGYDNYVVRPVYESDKEESYASSLGSGYTSTITYLDDSRNQWNNGASGNYASVTKQTNLEAADKIFTDFAITYNYDGKNINTISSGDAKIRVGMVIERLDTLDSVGSTKITDASYYANKYKTDTGWENLAGRLEGSTSGTLTSAVTSGHKCYNSKIGANYDFDGYTLFGTPAPGAVTGQSTVVDNFNRLQWFYTFNNFGSGENMKNYAYRAVSYMIVTDNEGTQHAYLTDTPAYFTFYDTATRAGN